MGTTADKLAYLEGTKAAIREAISARGVELSESAPFREYAERIGEIGGPAARCRRTRRRSTPASGLPTG